MAFTLRLTLHGVARFVERSETEVSVLMCDLKGLVPSPLTYLKFPEKTFDRKHTPRRPGRERSDGQQFFALKGEHLTIAAPNVKPAHKKLDVNWKRDQFSETPTKYDEFSLVWLTHLRKLEPKLGDVNPGYLQIPPRTTGANPPLNVRVDLEQGYLRTNGVERMQLRFKRQDPESVAQLLPTARELVLELRVEGDYVDIVSSPLKGSGPKQPDMRFRPHDSEYLDLVIGNESKKDMFQHTPPIMPIDLLKTRAAKEYVFYYDMCATRPKDPFLPFVSARPSGDTYCSVDG